MNVPPETRKGRRITLEAPDDSFIDEIVVDGLVARNQRIVTLRSPRLDRLISRVRAFQKQVEIAERPFHDGRVNEEISALLGKAKNLKNAGGMHDIIVSDLEQRFHAGTATPEDLYKAQVEATNAANACIDAQLAADQAEKKKQDMLDKLASTKESLLEHQLFLQTMHAAMAIISPARGQFISHVGVGWFVKKGHIVGEIAV